MKTNHKLNKLLGSLAIAFAMMLFLPSAVNAGKNSHGSHGSYGKSSHGSHGSYGKSSHGSHGSYGKSSYGNHGSYGKGSYGNRGNYGSQYKNWKAKAAKYLKKYYRTRGYTYYQKYVYCIKQAKTCQNTPTTTNCNVYKTYADKYLAAYKQCGYYVYYKYYRYFKNKYTKCQANMNTTGKVCGSVFEDTDGNGVQDAGEPSYAGAKVTITDTNGKTVTATTDAQGKYCQDGIEAGDATITVVQTSLPTGARITTDNPSTIDVDAGITNQAGKDGFEPAATVGKVCGSVFEDTDGNGVQDAGEPSYAGAKVTITDVNGNTVTVTTDAQGKYCQDGIEAGNATITVDPTSLPTGARITTDNPSTIDVEAGKNNQAGKDGFEPLQTGSVKGFVFEDFYSDTEYNPNNSDSPIANVPVSLTVNGQTFNTTTDANGTYNFNNIPVGDAIVTIDEDYIKEKYPKTVQTAGINPSPVTVVANTLADAGEDGYSYRKCGFIKGFVYIDKNKNGKFDSHDVRASNVKVKIDIEGHTSAPSTVLTNSIGIWAACIHKPQGTKVTVTVDQADLEDKYGVGASLSEGQNPNTVSINLGFYTDAGTDGFQLR